MKRIHLLWSLCLALFALTGCDTNLEEIDTSYTIYSIESINPPSGYSYLNLTVTLDGEDIKGIYFPGREERMGVLKITYPDYTPLEQTVTLQPSQVIQLLFKPDKTIELYDEERFLSFNCIFLFSGYNVKLNGEQLTSGLNYIEKEKASGTLEFYKEGGTTPTATIPDITLTEGTVLKLMQLSDTQFIEIPKDTEPDPESKDYTKMRFFYTQDAIPGVASVKMIIYTYSYSDYSTQEIGSLEFNANNFSPYIQADVQFAGGSSGCLIYDLIDAETGNKIVDNEIHILTSINGYGTTYKKQTLRITDSTGEGGDNVRVDIVTDLSEPW